MKSLVSLKDEDARVHTLSGNLATLKKNLERAISLIESDGRSETYTRQAIREARARYIEKVAPVMEEIQISLKKVQIHKRFFQDRETLLLRYPITERAADGLSAQNIHAEFAARNGVLQIASMMSNERLKRESEYCIERGEIGTAALYAFVGNNRIESAKIDLSKVTLPEQEAALTTIREIERLAETATLDSLEMSGRPKADLLVGRLAAAH